MSVESLQVESICGLTFALPVPRVPQTEEEVAALWADAPEHWRSPALNAGRLLEVLAYIDKHPDRWNQEFYACQTVGCMGGWTVALHQEVDIALLPLALNMNGQGAASVPALAQELLGLTAVQVPFLFGFLQVYDPAIATRRHPTFDELVDRVRMVTGVDYRARHVDPPADVIALPGRDLAMTAAQELVGAAA
jgi:hypothetical protein